MKKNILLLVLSCQCLALFSQRTIDVLQYKFSIEVSDVSDTIYGEAEITAIAKKGSNVFPIDLTGGMSGKQKGMTVTFVRSYHNEGGKQREVANFVHDNGRLTIDLLPDLKTGLSKDDTVVAVIKYKGVPADGLIISKNKFGHRTFFADNWPNRAHNWIPCVDDPADKASVEFAITAPSHYQVVANGIEVEETNLPGNKRLTRYKEDVPLPTKIMAIGIADFAVLKSGQVDCVPVYTWVFPENRPEGFLDYGVAPEILAYHINYIGPYPYRKLANIQSKTIFGGMENAGAIFYAESSVTGKKKEEDLLSHEIVHQWFGDMATEKSFAHLWLSEGFATYLTHVYIESKYGTDSLNKEMRIDRDQVIAFVKTSHKPVVDSTKDLMELLNANSYQKGSWVLHMLRRELGDTIFRRSIRQYYAQYAGKNAETSDLQKVFENVSGKSLQQFFKQWLFTPENPSLDISWSYDAKNQKVNLHIRQLQNSLFQFPLSFSFSFPGNKKAIHHTIIDKKEMDVSFPANSKPSIVIADPSTSLLFEAKISETK